MSEPLVNSVGQANKFVVIVGDNGSDFILCSWHMSVLPITNMHYIYRFDACIVRGIEPLETLIPFLPEVPFTRVLRRASKSDLKLLQTKPADEAAAFNMIKLILEQHRGLVRHFAFFI